METQNSNQVNLKKTYKQNFLKMGLLNYIPKQVKSSHDKI